MVPLSYLLLPLLSTPGIIAFTTQHHHRHSSIFREEKQKEVILGISTSSDNKSSNGMDQQQQEQQQNELSLPWTEFQDWALRDNISKYLVSIPRPGATEPQLYGLWRTLSNEVVELSGYPAEILQQRYEEQQQKEQSPSLSTTPVILPLLDQYEFETSGGLSGRVYGIPGVAEGSKIQTTALRAIQTTLPKGYVLTDDNQEIIYELGSPIRLPYDANNRQQQLLTTTADKMTTMTTTQLAASADDVLSQAGRAATVVVGDDAMLIRLGAITGILLAGATAVNMLSHHLTVNVFWT